MLFSSEIAGTTPKDVMDLLVLNQYFDTLTVNYVLWLHRLIFTRWIAGCCQAAQYEVCPSA